MKNRNKYKIYKKEQERNRINWKQKNDEPRLYNGITVSLCLEATHMTGPDGLGVPRLK